MIDVALIALSLALAPPSSARIMTGNDAIAPWDVPMAPGLTLHTRTLPTHRGGLEVREV